MKSFVFKIAFIFFSMALLQSCGKDCGSEECPNVKPGTFGLRLLNNAGQDLLTGPAKAYDTAQVRIRARRVTTNSVEEINRNFFILKNSIGTADSLITTGFTVSRTYAAYYLLLNNVVTDSLVFGYNNMMTACCDLSNYYLDKVNLTDVQNLDLPSTYIIRK